MRNATATAILRAAFSRKHGLEKMIMRRMGAVVLAGGLALLLGGAALAASSQTPVPVVDPTAKNLTPYMIKLRAFDACLVNQSGLLKTTREAVHTPCSCYANGTIESMTKDEIQAFRDTGYFNDSAREKALSFLDKCKLKRPF